MITYPCPKCEKPLYEMTTSRRGIIYRCRTAGKTCYETKYPEAATIQTARKAAPVISKKFKQTLEKKTFIVTSAQNATGLHKGFFTALKTFAKARQAQILVVPFRYKNPTSRWTASQNNEEVWAEELTPYLCNERKRLAPYLMLLGDVKIQPTARTPLTGLEGVTGLKSGVVGHPHVALDTIAVPANSLPKIMATTGACTVRNYTDSRQGALGKFHHVIGAVVIETEGKRFHMRHVAADADGSFTDLDTVYTETGTRKAPRASSITFGDMHVAVVDPKVVKATFGPGGIVPLLRPEHLFYHDLFDGQSCNPHETNNPFLAIARQTFKKDQIADEVLSALQFVDKYTPADSTPYIVGSNHDDFLSRWILNTDWRSLTDKKNAAFYLDTATYILSGIKDNPGGPSYPGAFALWAKVFSNRKDIRVLGKNDSVMLLGVEQSLHGDKGPNGSRGTLLNLSKLGVRVTVGHSHGPGTKDGAMQTGTSSHLKLGYNVGPSGWLNGHVVQYASGKRTHIFIIDGKYRAS